MGNLKEMNGPVYDTEYKHIYQPNAPISNELTSQVGPVYKTEWKHNYGHDFNASIEQKEMHGPVMKVDHKHHYGADFSVKHRPPSPINGPIMPVERSHKYKAPLSKPHQRDLRARSYTPTYEVSKSHHYRESTTHKSDLTQMVGPIYNTGKIQLAKHNFTDGYQAPKARADQVELVNKFFKKDKGSMEVTTSSSSMSSSTMQQSSSIQAQQTQVSMKSGEERKKEALERRDEFLKQQQEISMKLNTSEFKTIEVKSKKELDEEREAIMLAAITRIKEESMSLSNRLKMEEQKRVEFIRAEEERQRQEDIMRQEAVLKAEEERKQKLEIERQAKIKREELLKAEQLEQQRLLEQKLKREEEERRQRKIVQKQDTVMQAEVQRKSTIMAQEEERRLQELRIMEEKRLQEKLHLEEMIRREKEQIKKGIVNRRTDDPFGQGFGFVKTGYVSSQKLSILQRAASVERQSPTPSNASSKTKGLRVTWAESPGSSRPGSNLAGPERIAELDALRAETPPLAAEWAVSKGNMVKYGAMSQQQTFSSSAQSSLATNTVNTLQSSQQKMASFASQKTFSASSSLKATSSSNSAFMESSSSFKSSAMKSSSFKESSQINTFEAFPGMGGIENLNLDGTSNSMLQ